MQRFRGGPVFKAHRLLHHSTLSLRVTQKKKRSGLVDRLGGGCKDVAPGCVFRFQHFVFRVQSPVFSFGFIIGVFRIQFQF